MAMNSSGTSWSYGDGHMNSEKFHFHDHHGTPRNNSAMSKMQHQYWVTKETVLRKFGKKEDEHIVASDAELDAKLELFKSIQDSCMDLQRIIDKYQERLCLLAQEENAMGRFLKEAGKGDKTGAGSLMLSLGKTMSQAGQLRISLRAPLLRLFQEVETFRERAIEDTERTVSTMEKSRTKYRASLSWMKDISQSLDPDAYSQMDKFKKVQGRVKTSKVVFDRYKVDTLEKVDLLAAARCNMFSHALLQYHNQLQKFASSSYAAYQAIAEICNEQHHFEWSAVKELSELKPAESSPPQQAVEQQETDEKLLNFDEFESLISTEDCPPPVDDKKTPGEEASSDEANSFLPSQLLLSEGKSFFSSPPPTSEIEDNASAVKKPTENPEKIKSSWLDLISELDPLSNPDSVGLKPSLEPFGDC